MSTTSLPFGNRDGPLRQSTSSLPCGYTGDTRTQSTASFPYGNREDPQGQSTASLSGGYTEDPRDLSTARLPYSIVPPAPPIQRTDAYPKFQTLADGGVSPDREQRGGEGGGEGGEGGEEWKDSVKGAERCRSHDLRQSHPYGIAAPVAPPMTPLPGTSLASHPQDSAPERGHPYTSRWAPSTPSDSFRRVELSILDPEYKAVLQNVHQMGGTKFTDKVKMICRVENYRLYKTFRCCREEQTRVNDRGTVNERILWHGTSADVLTNICRDGFNRSYCGKSATAYGDGVYFATSFEYSTSPTYSPPDSKGRKYIFQCRVLTGHYTQGQPGLKEPPLRLNEFRFDSVVDNMSAPAIFVVFKDMQVYPEYVITLTQ